MNLRDPRFQKTVQAMALVVFGFWLGALDARPSFEPRHWFMLVADLVGIASAAFILLRDVFTHKAEQ
jgi:hypothetical protein